MRVVVIDNETNPAKRRRRQYARNLTDALAEQKQHGENGMSPKQFHRALADSGLDVSMAAVYFWLAGDSAPKPEHQAVIARVLHQVPHLLFPLEVAS